MKFDMVMPKMGESITEGTIIKWLKSEGDTVEKDEFILEISTDKVDSEIPAPVAGKISKLLAAEGDTVEVGLPIAQIETDKDAVIETTEKEPKKEKKPAVAVEQEKKVETTTAVKLEKSEASRFYSPVVMNIAAENGISMSDLEKISGSGLNGRVSKKDVLAYLGQSKKGVQAESTPVREPAAAAVQPAQPVGMASGNGIEIIPMDHVRKSIAKHMVQSKLTSPHVGIYAEADVQGIYKIREKNKAKFKAREGMSLTYMPFIAEAAAKTLKEFPMVNASIDGDNILVKKFINLGIAVAVDYGLIVPNIFNADERNLVGLSRAINDLGTRARNKKLKPDEVSGGTFSISNFGVYGTTIGFPVINQPQVAILGVGAVKKRPVVVNDAIAIRPIMYLSLTFDHRLIDGAMGAQFLQRLVSYLEDYDPDMVL